jgi:hypothetical protein
MHLKINSRFDPDTKKETVLKVLFSSYKMQNMNHPFLKT